MLTTFHLFLFRNEVYMQEIISYCVRFYFCYIFLNQNINNMVEYRGKTETDLESKIRHYFYRIFQILCSASRRAFENNKRSNKHRDKNNKNINNKNTNRKKNTYSNTTTTSKTSSTTYKHPQQHNNSFIRDNTTPTRTATTKLKIA